MHTNLSARGRNIFIRYMLGGILLILCSLGIGSSIAHAQDARTSQLDKSYTASTLTLPDGTILEKLIINGSPVPHGWKEVANNRVRAAVKLLPEQDRGLK